MCMCSKWLVAAPKAEGGRTQYFTTEEQARAYAAKFKGVSTIKPPTKPKASVR